MMRIAAIYKIQVRGEGYVVILSDDGSRFQIADVIKPIDDSKEGGFLDIAQTRWTGRNFTMQLSPSYCVVKDALGFLLDASDALHNVIKNENKEGRQ